MTVRVAGCGILALLLIASSRERISGERSRPAGVGYYASPAGRASNPGTRDRPWDLPTALAGAGGRVQPGDTIWLLGGRYVGTQLTTHLRGTSTARITFRQAPGHRAIIDGRLLARGAYLDFWGFEITQSRPLDHPEIQLLDARTDHGRFINLVLHDANTHGLNFWTPGVDAELYGCIIYNNGTHENLDHGVYVHNEAGTKRLVDNIFFNNYARGIQVYATRRNTVLRDVHVEGNISFNNGTISATSTRVNLLFNAEVPVENMSAVDNVLLFSSGVDGINARLGRAQQQYRGLTFRRNYLIGGRIGVELSREWEDIAVDSNTVVAMPGTLPVATSGTTRSYKWASNRYVADAASPGWAHDGRRLNFASWRARTGLGSTDRAGEPSPTRPRIFIRPNKYERGRAHVAVVNFGLSPSVSVDLASLLRVGDRFEVRNVQDLGGTPVAAGVFSGAPVQLPMAGVNPPTPIGRVAPNRAPRTAPLFDVFLVTTVAPQR